MNESERSAVILALRSPAYDGLDAEAAWAAFHSPARQTEVVRVERATPPPIAEIPGRAERAAAFLDALGSADAARGLAGSPDALARFCAALGELDVDFLKLLAVAAHRAGVASDEGLAAALALCEAGVASEEIALVAEGPSDRDRTIPDPDREFPAGDGFTRSIPRDVFAALFAAARSEE